MATSTATQCILDDWMENGQIIATNDGILLRRAPAAYLGEITNNTTGTLTIVNYQHRLIADKHVLCIEWQPNNFMIADSHENDDWSIVDTITRRQRTASESLAFGTDAESSSSQSPGSGTTANAATPPPSAQAARRIRIGITELQHVEVLKNNHLLRLVTKCDRKVHSEYFFQHGNAEGFVRGLHTTHCLRRSANKRDLYEIVENVKHDTDKLKKTFAELRIDEIKGPGNTGWLTNMVRDPLGQTMGLLVKMSDVYTALPGMSGDTPPEERPTAPPQSTYQNNHEISGTSSNRTIDEYDLLNMSEPIPEENSPPELPPRPTVTRGACLDEKQWNEFMSEDGVVTEVDRIKEIIFRGGVSHGLRVTVWKYLLGYWRWDETHEQRKKIKLQKTSEYFKMKMQWLSMTPVQEKNFVGYQNRKCQIEKDVLRQDRTVPYFEGDNNPNLSRLQDILLTYVMYNFDLGYVQGMGDLLAPILCIMEDEVDSFWCFVAFMNRMFSNFEMDQMKMKHQFQNLQDLMEFCNPRLYAYFRKHDSHNMFVCFRWLLVWFKREFSHNDIMCVWETIWTGLPCQNFHLVISVAILDSQMDTIIGRNYEFHEIVRFVNDLSSKLDYVQVLNAAEALYLQIKAAPHLTDRIRSIIGEPLEEEASAGNVDDDDDDDDDNDGFDTIAPTAKSVEEMCAEQKKIEEACERSMYNTFF